MTLPVAAGDRLPGLSRLIDQALINAYADVSGDHNPIHVDPAFAGATMFGGTILHGYFTMALASQMMERWRPRDWRDGGQLTVNFLGAVRPGDRLEISAVVDDIVDEPERAALCAITGQVGDRIVLAGVGMCPLRSEG